MFRSVRWAVFLPLLVGGTVLALAPGVWAASADDRDGPPATGQNKPESRGKPPEEELGEFDLEGLLKDRNPRPVNGVTVRIRPALAPAGESEAVEVGWVIRYSGPRPPLTILRPSLTVGENDRETELMFFATGKSGKTYGHGFRNSVDVFGVTPEDSPFRMRSEDLHRFLVDKEGRFLVVHPGEAGRGKLRVKVADLKENLRRRKPDEFDPARPPTLHVKLYLHPQNRGAAYGLDAWTGKVDSNLVPLTLTRW